jgi:hypothetical protein
MILSHLHPPPTPKTYFSKIYPNVILLLIANYCYMYFLKYSLYLRIFKINVENLKSLGENRITRT